MQTRTKKGIMFGSLLAALSASPLLLASRPAQAESVTLDVQPRRGPAGLTPTTWTNTVGLTGTNSSWDTFSFYYQFQGNDTTVVPAAGPNWILIGTILTKTSYVNSGGANFYTATGQPLWVDADYFVQTGTYDCYADDWGTNGGTSNWFHNVGFVPVVIS